MNTPVNFETAKLLKERGFGEKSCSFYDLTSNTQINDAPLGNYNLTKQSVSIPNIPEVVVWLYEKHGIWVRVEPDWDGDFWAQIKSREIPDARIGKWQVVTALAPYKSPTEAYEAGIVYALNNLI